MSAGIELSNDDLVSIWIGRVCRIDVEIESTLKWIYRLLAGENGLVWAAMPSMMGAVIVGIRKMLAVSGFDEEMLLDIRVGLKKIEDAHEGRNRLVHDGWEPSLLGSDTFTPVTTNPYPSERLEWDVPKFEACHEALQRAQHIVRGMFFVVMHLASETQEVGEAFLAEQRRQLRGEFERDLSAVYVDHLGRLQPVWLFT